eukprot:TRINITY_DN2563_c0_g1_i1.p1 TRINITY_DN2563_c0_g1~~TRINITY_DN2563_c0_g1_i1.p1  ORF type:complete len:432 (-),score=87.73 TRINITY_DN2563_c0_g1_i1:1149-2444(-)
MKLEGCYIFFLICFIAVQCFDSSDVGWVPIQQKQSTIPTDRYEFILERYENQSILFGGREEGWCSFYNDTYLFNHENNGWEKLIGLNPSPQERFASISGIVNDTLYLIFGMTYYEACTDNEQEHLFNDIWSFNFSKKEWIKVGENYSNVYPRVDSYSYIYDNKICFYGGKARFNDVVTEFSDHYCYNVDVNAFEIIHGNYSSTDEQVIPSGRYAGVCGVYTLEKQLIIHGGRYGKGKEVYTLSEVWKMNLKTKEWTLLSNSTIFDRYQHAGGVYDKYLVIFGGEYLSAYFDSNNKMIKNRAWLADTQVFDLSANQWIKLNQADSFISSPSSRAQSGYYFFEHKFYLFGGRFNFKSLYEDDLNDFWVLDLEKVESFKNSIVLNNQLNLQISQTSLFLVILTVLSVVLFSFVLILLAKYKKLKKIAHSQLNSI